MKWGYFTFGFRLFRTVVRCLRAVFVQLRAVFCAVAPYERRLSHDGVTPPIHAASDFALTLHLQQVTTAGVCTGHGIAGQMWSHFRPMPRTAGSQSVGERAEMGAAIRRSVNRSKPTVRCLPSPFVSINVGRARHRAPEWESSMRSSRQGSRLLG